MAGSANETARLRREAVRVGHQQEHERVGELPHLIYMPARKAGRSIWVLRSHGVVASAPTRRGVIIAHSKVRQQRKADGRG